MGIQDFYFDFIVPAKKANREGSPDERQVLYATVFSSISSVGDVKYLHIDANSLIYNALEACTLPKGFEKRLESRDDLDDLLEEARKIIESESTETLLERLMSLTYAMIEDIIALVKPTESATIDFDGCVPWAKVVSQRKGRYSRREGGSIFDKTSISPGTKFMVDLCEYLKAKLRKREEGKPKVVVLSTTLTWGEGEHKIVDKILESKTERTPGSIVVYSTDSDMILLAMKLKMASLFVLSSVNFQSIDSVLRSSGLKTRHRDERDNFINTFSLRTAIMEDIGNESLTIDDFIYVMSILGNDFVPKPYCCRDVGRTIQKIMSVLKEMDAPIVNADVVIYDSLLLFMKKMALGTSKILSEKAMVEKRVATLLEDKQEAVIHSTIDGVFSFDSFVVEWYANEFEPRNISLAKKYGMNIYSEDPSAFDGEKDEMCKQFIKGMSWVFAYYSHNADNLSMTWYYPYNYAPLIEDLYLFLDSSSEDVVQYPENIVLPGIPHQLVAIIPYSSIMSNIPSNLHALWMKDSPIIAYMPIHVREDASELKEKDLWRSVKIMPLPSFERVNEALSPYKSTKSYLSLMKQEKDFYFAGVKREDTSSRGRYKRSQRR